MDVVEGRQRKEASLRGVDAVVDLFEVLRGGCSRRTPEEGGIAPGRDSVGGYY